MEIKRGISQMAEYPNVEINYVVPKSGNMHYVLKEGILNNGVIIATLDPRHAIDEGNPCQNIGVFSATGDVLIDFNKKDIKKITDNLLLVVNSVPTTSLVATPDDMEAISNKDLIVQMMLQEMGSTGEIIFADPYSEANVYATDSYNNKVGIDCSFIGKNNEGLYFHTNDVNSLSKFIKVDEFSENSIENEFTNVPLNNISEEPVTNTEDVTEEEDLQLNINPTILGGFNIPQEEPVDNKVETTIEPTEVQLTENNTEISNISSEIEEPETTEDDSTGEEENAPSQEQQEEITEDENSEEEESNTEVEENSTEEKEEKAEEESSEEESDTEVDDNSTEEKEEKTEEENSEEEESDTEVKEDSAEEEQEEKTEEESSEDDESDTEVEEDSTEEEQEETTEEESSEDDKSDTVVEEDEKDEEEEDSYMEKSRRNTRRKSVLDNENNDVEILDEAIDIINKMMEETDKLNKRIKKLEARLDEKEQVIQEQTELIEEQDNKKSELNSILNKASRLLENIE